MEAVPAIIKQLLVSMGFKEASVERSEVAGQTIFSIRAPGDPRELIGPHGDTIHAIDHLVKKIAESRSAPREAGPSTEVGVNREPLAPSRAEGMFLVDVDEYRTRQIKDIENKAKMMAERARSFQYDVELSPMSAYERLIIHTALAGEPHVKTESQGEGRNRRVVIKYSAN